MIGVIFSFAGEYVEVRINDNNVLFRSGTLPGYATIENLQLSKRGVCKEFPDLINNTDWRTIAIDRFKEKVSTYTTETDKMNYIIEDLKKHGYIPQYIQKGGHRVKRIK